MTTEEKAKAYDEALERLKPLYEQAKKDGNPIWSTYEYLIPELAESEDERIRKEIVHYILYKAKGVSEEQEHAWIVYLEKQNEQKHGAIDAKSERVIKAARSVLNNWLDGTDCPDVSGDFAELEYAIRKYDGEEKQKEQKKEPVEHWQYVGRVNLEEDKEEQRPMADQPFEEWLDGWFKEHEEDGEIKMTAKEFKNWSRGIRNMYAEQKPVEIKIDNPNIQKFDPDVKISTSDSSASGDGLIYASWRDEKAEQNSNIELIQKSWYMEGYHDCEFGYEPRWVIKTGEGGPRYEENPKYGQPLIEQRPTEEQLHNLNEAIKSFRMDGFDRIADSLHSLYNCILKTQEQKSAECSVKGRRGRIGNTPEHIRKKAENFLSKMEPPYDADDICSAYETGAMESIKQEWSEDFDKEVENIHKRYPEVSFAKLTRIAYHFSKWANRYKDTEWGEDDETYLQDALWCIEKAEKVAKDEGDMGACWSARRWLKSLRPVSKESLQSWKPSEEQIYSLGTVVKGYNECTVGSVGYNLKELYRQLKELK